MRALLDVNVLIALLDADHIAHHTAVAWLGEHGAQGWASCPITQNGCLRIMSAPRYPNPSSVHAVAARLRDATAHAVHEFWSDDISLLDDRTFDTSRIHGPGQLTDLYLLALAVARGGRLVTFDQSVVVDAVRDATHAHLVRL